MHSTLHFQRVRYVEGCCDNAKVKEEEEADPLFGKIVSGELPVNKIYEDEQCLAFHDINPVADVHALVLVSLSVALCDVDVGFVVDSQETSAWYRCS